VWRVCATLVALAAGAHLQRGVDYDRKRATDLGGAADVATHPLRDLVGKVRSFALVRTTADRDGPSDIERGFCVRRNRWRWRR